MKLQSANYCRKLQISTLWSLLLICLSSPLMAGEFYKWTDDKGVVHYSQRAPQDTATATETVRTYNTGNTGTKNPSTSSTTPSDSEAGTTTEETAVEPAKKDPALCERAKKDSEVLRTKPLVRQNGKVLTIDEKNEQIKKLQDIAKVHC